jgi:predicted PurR-regulated permease PerM
MEALAGLSVLVIVFVVVFCLIGALVILSIAIDSARLVRRTNKIIELLKQQNAQLDSLTSNLRTSTRPAT